MAKVLRGDIARIPSAIRPGLPTWLDAIVSKALATNPDERYASANEMRDALAWCARQCPRIVTHQEELLQRSSPEGKAEAQEMGLEKFVFQALRAIVDLGAVHPDPEYSCSNFTISYLRSKTNSP